MVFNNRRNEWEAAFPAAGVSIPAHQVVADSPVEPEKSLIPAGSAEGIQVGIYDFVFVDSR